jgi:hypothetical protein
MLSLATPSKLSELFANYHRERIMGYSAFTYTFHVWGENEKDSAK